MNSFQFRMQSRLFTIKTHEKLFSPRGLDSGTEAMLARVSLAPGQRVLDLGCGYGIVGFWAAAQVGPENVVMLDNDPLAVETARENARVNGMAIKIIQSDGFAALDETAFDWILCNPPYHADFSVAKHFIEKGFNRLVIGGRMAMVVKRKEWYKNKLTSIFGDVQSGAEGEYTIFIAQRRTSHYFAKSNMN